jgi:excisionase family DNA binding protein
MERLLKAEDVADLLQVPVGTLYRWRYSRTGPRAMKVGRHLRYLRSDVEAWLAARGNLADPGDEPGTDSPRGRHK